MVIGVSRELSGLSVTGIAGAGRVPERTGLEFSDGIEELWRSDGEEVNDEDGLVLAGGVSVHGPELAVLLEANVDVLSADPELSGIGARSAALAGLVGWLRA